MKTTLKKRNSTLTDPFNPDWGVITLNNHSVPIWNISDAASTEVWVFRLENMNYNTLWNPLQPVFVGKRCIVRKQTQKSHWRQNVKDIRTETQHVVFPCGNVTGIKFGNVGARCSRHGAAVLWPPAPSCCSVVWYKPESTVWQTLALNTPVCYDYSDPAGLEPATFCLQGGAFRSLSHRQTAGCRYFTPAPCFQMWGRGLHAIR